MTSSSFYNTSTECRPLLKSIQVWQSSYCFQLLSLLVYSPSFVLGSSSLLFFINNLFSGIRCFRVAFWLCVWINFWMETIHIKAGSFSCKFKPIFCTKDPLRHRHAQGNSAGNAYFPSSVSLSFKSVLKEPLWLFSELPVSFIAFPIVNYEIPTYVFK